MQTQFGESMTNKHKPFDFKCNYIDFPPLNRNLYNYETIHNLNEQYLKNKVESLETKIKQLEEENKKLKDLLLKTLLK